MTLAIVLAAAYAAGSVNFSILVFRGLGRGDPRSRHSGNPGTTNVARQLGLRWAALVLGLDMGRAAAVAWAALSFLSEVMVPWAGLALVAGNRWPVWHGFRGGKGVANYLGFTLVVAPLAGVLAGLVWGALFKLTRQPFIGSFGMVAVLGGGQMWRLPYSPGMVMGVLAAMGLIAAAHRKNVAQYLSGAEKTA
jgi:glycerol-3-phosphate acyltransferase PlsY